MQLNRKAAEFKRLRKRLRIRKKIMGTPERPRLAVFRSSKNIYAQLVDDLHHKTLTGVSTLNPELRSELEKVEGKIGAAKLVGKKIAEKAKELNIEQVVFDRGGYMYHGRVKAVAEAARASGLKF
jgi:large subunit ribosomal protein L18